MVRRPIWFGGLEGMVGRPRRPSRVGGSLYKGTNTVVEGGVDSMVSRPSCGRGGTVEEPSSWVGGFWVRGPRTQLAWMPSLGLGRGRMLSLEGIFVSNRLA